MIPAHRKNEENKFKEKVVEPVEKIPKGDPEIEIEKLRRQVSELTTTLTQMQKKPKYIPNQEKTNNSSEKYCAYCVSKSHNLTDCWRRPPPGHCFDCRRYGCRRGNRNCPGRPRSVITRTSHDRNKE